MANLKDSFEVDSKIERRSMPLNKEEEGNGSETPSSGTPVLKQAGKNLKHLFEVDKKNESWCDLLEEEEDSDSETKSKVSPVNVKQEVKSEPQVQVKVETNGRREETLSHVKVNKEEPDLKFKAVDFVADVKIKQEKEEEDERIAQAFDELEGECVQRIKPEGVKTELSPTKKESCESFINLKIKQESEESIDAEVLKVEGREEKVISKKPFSGLQIKKDEEEELMDAVKEEVRDADNQDVHMLSPPKSEGKRKRSRKRSKGGTPDKIRDSSASSNSSAASKRSKRDGKVELETDPTTLTRRQKQIDYGKNTVGYDRYSQTIPKHKRGKNHPKTPPKHLKYSRRAWDGLVRVWRQRLHIWDPPNSGEELPSMNSLSDISVEIDSNSERQARVKRNAQLSLGSSSIDDSDDFLLLEDNDVEENV